MAGILKQLKRPTKKVALKPSDISEPDAQRGGAAVCAGPPGHLSSCCAGGVEDPGGPCSGDRESNRWLQYHSQDLPLSQERWDALRYVEKTHWGYSCWPR